MALRHLGRLTLVLAPLAFFAAGCGPEEIKLKAVPASEAMPPPKAENRLKSEMKAKPGSSAGMNYDPGGTTNKKDVD
jgi:hypothetical protein